MTASLLVIDNYDSFTFNLIQMIMPFGFSTEVRRNDQTSIEEIEALAPRGILISPGPKYPARAGLSLEIIRHFSAHTPVLGVCLGLQCINECFGGRTVRAPVPVHGKTSLVEHTGRGLFRNLPSPFKAARYHSLQALPSPDTELEITAWTSEGLVMGLAHPVRPLAGVQFHPESFLTECGRYIIENFFADFKTGI